MRQRNLWGMICLLAAGVVTFDWGLVYGADDSPKTESPQPAVAFAQEDLDFFERKIRPVLISKCYECHSEEAAQRNRLKGGLRLDSRDGLLRGGDSGPAIVPAKSGESLLLNSLKYESFEMPPSGRLNEQVIKDFEHWIDHGAADPRTESSKPSRAIGIDFDQGRQHWAYRPLSRPNIPLSSDQQGATTTSQVAGPIDAFVAAKLEAQNLKPAASATRETLIRRLYFDLIGLPPRPEDIQEFVADERPDAVDRIVDRLLASPHFGIRWGRRWLSVVRFAESMTLRGFVFPEAWRYRDYVIHSFNSDHPFDQFVVEHLAGDLLTSDDLAERQRQCVATTFLAMGNINLEEQDKQQLRMDVVDEQLEAIGKGFLAQTLGCARCHDHKFDPIPTRDYYAMAGILANVKTLEDANVSKWIERPLPVEPQAEAVFVAAEAAVADLKKKIATAEAAQKALKKPTPTKDKSTNVDTNEIPWAEAVKDAAIFEEEKARLDKELKQLKQDLKSLQASSPRRPRYMSVEEALPIADIRIHIRGTVHNLGETVPRGFMQVFDDSRVASPIQSGRKEFGAWIVSQANPLTPRVLSNRFWYWLFGAGLSRTPDNFGTTGDAPTHPELLDYLAARLWEKDWAMKPLIREIVCSKAYQASSETTTQTPAVDIENRLWSRQNRRRLDAECLLDAILTSGDHWNDELGGPEFPYSQGEDYGYTHSSRRRAVYWPVFRNSLPRIFETFDFADPSIPTAVRNTSTVASQSLFFLNNDWALAEAKRTAERILSERHLSDSLRVDRAYRLILGRRPSDCEMQISLQELETQADDKQALASLIQALFASIDFRYLE